MSEVWQGVSAVGERVSVLYGAKHGFFDGDASGRDYHGRRVCNNIGFPV